MKTLFKSDLPNKPKLSVLLLDWSVRESFHVLRYLNEQTVPRDRYEILWIEYYKRQAPAIRSALDRSKKDGQAPCVDQWILLEMPEDVYYHKHLMYNAGIVMSRGRITVICDSDVMVKPSFVESILKEFEKDERIALHLDEVRNVHKKFYPFNYPLFDEVTGEGCINWKDDKTTGLLDDSDILHTRNYGACMCALRQALIEIGGADEHIDYLGHICGPYELTLRLANSGKKEIWHPSEFLFHTWHPGADGVNNYLGPHDGKNMSTTALQIRTHRRTLPLVENSAIRLLRIKDDIRYVSSEECVISERALRNWSVGNIKNKFDIKRSIKELLLQEISLRQGLRLLAANLTLGFSLISLTWRQTRAKAKNHKPSLAMKKNLLEKSRDAFVFITRIWKNNLFLVEVYGLKLDECVREGVKEVALYGQGPMDAALLALIRVKGIPFKGSYGFSDQKCLENYEGKVILSSFDEAMKERRELEALGIMEENLVSWP